MVRHCWLFILLLLGTLLITSCGPSETEKEMSMQLTLQALQMTLAAETSQPQPEEQITSTNTVEVKMEEEDSEDAEGETPCHASRFVSETIPDGSSFDTGETFEKTWTIRNAGTCDWTEDYAFEFESGTRMGGESRIELDKIIKPNETITFKVNLTAPSTDDVYTGVWRMKADDGEKMGQYWVNIIVGSGEAADADDEEQDEAPGTSFAVTRVIFPHIDPILCVCPATLGVAADITVNKAGTVTFRWEDNQGGTKNDSIIFDSAGTKTVHYTIPIPTGGDGTYSARIYIDIPNHQYFDSIDVEVDCS